jgi:hypothetical protein
MQKPANQPATQRVTARATTVPIGVPQVPSRARPGLDVLDGGRQPLRFGEFLVTEGALDRQQLFWAMQMQDRYPDVKIGECAAALGYLDLTSLDRHYARFLANARRAG